MAFQDRFFGKNGGKGKRYTQNDYFNEENALFRLEQKLKKEGWTDLFKDNLHPDDDHSKIDFVFTGKDRYGAKSLLFTEYKRREGGSARFPTYPFQLKKYEAMFREWRSYLSMNEFKNAFGCIVWEFDDIMYYHSFSLKGRSLCEKYKIEKRFGARILSENQRKYAQNYEPAIMIPRSHCNYIAKESQ